MLPQVMIWFKVPGPICKKYDPPFYVCFTPVSNNHSFHTSCEDVGICFLFVKIFDHIVSEWTQQKYYEMVW